MRAQNTNIPKRQAGYPRFPHDVDGSPPGEVVTYKLSTEELAEYNRKNPRVAKITKAPPQYKIGSTPKVKEGENVMDQAEGLTKEKYLEFKKQGLADSKIREKFQGVHTVKLTKLKREWGLAGMSRKDIEMPKFEPPTIPAVDIPVMPRIADEVKVVEGVGKNEPITTNAKGGKQAKVHYRFDLVDPKAMFEMTKVLKEGFNKYGSDENWRRIEVREHLNHLLIHAYAYLAGDTSDEHLSHLMCRAMFAQAVDLDEKKS